MNYLKKHIRKIVIVMAGILTLQFVMQTNFVNAEQTHYWYSQKGLAYKGKTLTSMCYITCYSMILKNLGIDTDPLGVYVANGCSNYANHTKIGAAYDVDTSEKGSLSGLSTAKKKEKIRELLKEHPEGIIVGGCYSGSSYHYVVAVKADEQYIYFDDPAHSSEAEGCCIKLEKTWKLTWSNLSMYRVIKKNSTVTTTLTPQPSETAEPIVTDPAVPSNDNPVVVTPEPTAISIDVKDYKVPTRSIYLKNPIMTGEDVKWVQAALYTLGYNISVDGKFGSGSKKIVKTYQKDKKLVSDGCVGSGTRKSLLSSLDQKTAKEALEKVKKLKAKKSALESDNTYSATLSWKKQETATGYQIVYADNKKFTSKKKKTTAKTTSKLTKLTANKTYYVKVRAYTTVDKVKVYGAYSAVQKIKVSK